MPRTTTKKNPTPPAPPYEELTAVADQPAKVVLWSARTATFRNSDDDDSRYYVAATRGGVALEVTTVDWEGDDEYELPRVFEIGRNLSGRTIIPLEAARSLVAALTRAIEAAES